MSVQHAGAIIREARLKAGLSQEKLSEGICSVLSLSRIENGTAGVSPSTFQALMAHAGVPCEAYPIFASRDDFDCFYTLKRARFYLDCWQLKEAYEELDKIEKKNFAKNKYYYQEWLLLHSKLQLRSGCGNHSDIFQTLLDAIHISRPDIDLSDFRELLLSLNELELLIYISHEMLYSDTKSYCLDICIQISSYLENSPLSFLEKERLLAENAIVYSKYLLASKDYPAAFTLTDTFRKKTIQNADDSSLHELTFLTGLSLYHIGKCSEALVLFKTAYYSAHSIGSCYATTIQHYLMDELGISLFDSSLKIEEVPLLSYEIKKVIDTSDFSDGTYDLFSRETLTLGDLIRELRTEQKISQQALCLGLCSKSKLSKIENGTLQPDIALAQSLLQRLGISDAVFTFYGSEHESELQNLRIQLTSLRSSDVEKILDSVNKMQELCSEKDILYLQYATYKKARLIQNKIESMNALLDSLNLTIPDFNFNKLHSYHLSWLELTILNNYYNLFRQASPSKGILELYKLLDYYENTYLDVLAKKRVFAIPFCNLIASLHSQKRFSELIELEPIFSSPSIRYSLHITGVTFANYAQALGETNQLAQVPVYACYAYYNLLITNAIKTAEALKEDILNDFNITLV